MALRDRHQDGAGISARHEYERYRAAERQRLERKTGRRLAPLGRLIAGESDSERHWRLGAEGEERTAHRLGRLLEGRGVIVLHDRRIPGSRSNIDHICVSRAGVTVIDSKNWKGKPQVVRGELRVDGRRRPKVIEGMQRQMDVVRRALGEAHFDQVPVRGAICWLQVDALPVLKRLRCGEVRIDGPRPIAKFVRSGTGLAEELVPIVGDTLLAGLPPAR